MSESAIVVGGGLIGLLTARELVSRGVHVSVIEQGDVGRAASWAGGGILSPLHPWRYPQAVYDLVHASQQLYPSLCAELAEATGIDPEWTRSGLLVLGADIPVATAWAAAHREHGQVIAGPRVVDLEPALAPSAAPAFWLPEVAQVRNPRLLQALSADLIRRGVAFITHTQVQGIDETGAGLTARADTGRWTAKTIVVTAGAWTARLCAPWGMLPITPVKGQMIQLATPPGTLRTIVLEGARYVVPRRDGLVLVGSTLEDAGFDARTTPIARAELVAFAQKLAPVLGASPVINQWAGLRPAAPEGVPYIGAHPQVPGLYINAGHFRNGVVMAPASARLVVDQMLGVPPKINHTPFAINRANNMNLS